MRVRVYRIHRVHGRKRKCACNPPPNTHTHIYTHTHPTVDRPVSVPSAVDDPFARRGPVRPSGARVAARRTWRTAAPAAAKFCASRARNSVAKTIFEFLMAAVYTTCCENNTHAARRPSCTRRRQHRETRVSGARVLVVWGRNQQRNATKKKKKNARYENSSLVRARPRGSRNGLPGQWFSTEGVAKFFLRVDDVGS